MDDGVVVEQGSPAEVIDAPRHARTRAFLSKVL
jgi:polar amino acid transport system ATP-binding protein